MKPFMYASVHHKPCNTSVTCTGMEAKIEQIISYNWNTQSLLVMLEFKLSGHSYSQVLHRGTDL